MGKNDDSRKHTLIYLRFRELASDERPELLGINNPGKAMNF